MFANIKKTYNEFPESFWVITFATFIDQIGSYMLGPFIYIYMSQVFGLSMVGVGIVFIISAIGSLIGGMIGGSLADKIGRKKCALFGLMASGIFSLTFVFISNVNMIYILIGIMGLLGTIGGPARQAMLADVLTVEKRPEGFSILRVIFNLSAAIGPALGGLLSSFDFKWLFIGDAVSSFITAIIFVLKVPETRPPKIETNDILPDVASTLVKAEKTKSGYGEIFKNWRFMIFVFVSALMGLAYMQMNSTLSVFLIEDLSFTNQQYGLLMSMNALMVVLLQFWLTKRIKMFPALIMIAVGNILYGIGFGMYGFIGTIQLAFGAMIIITTGEMVQAPFNQTMVANFAPEDKRGRYSAVFMSARLVPMLLGPIGAGVIMDNLDRKILWYIVGLLTFIAALGYVVLHFVTKDYFTQMKNDQKSLDDLNNESLAETDILV
ncbi:Multidrug resistance protein MdtH [Candidatus Lokiarchaeum ossiferum]|uniref:Multidrug resistance protein MdtH n=1 Tax=Candidatus Lokiarchaeum ossiferum TaxID=2951803 RepID=A0ABY6HLC5_9ARCH|nr:Multidrug resistance protein MdtH [Candidatus Lokiarchaeum sp. B-35]